MRSRIPSALALPGNGGKSFRRSVGRTNGKQEIEAFDGAGANINSDGTHFWPYGLNYNSEGNTESYRRHVLMVAAFRKDMGIQ